MKYLEMIWGKRRSNGVGIFLYVLWNGPGKNADSVSANSNENELIQQIVK